MNNNKINRIFLKKIKYILMNDIKTKILFYICSFLEQKELINNI